MKTTLYFVNKQFRGLIYVKVVKSQSQQAFSPMQHSRSKFNALLDACSTGPEGYIVNYIHPDVVQQIKIINQK